MTAFPEATISEHDGFAVRVCREPPNAGRFWVYHDRYGEYLRRDGTLGVDCSNGGWYDTYADALAAIEAYKEPEIVWVERCPLVGYLVVGYGDGKPSGNPRARKFVEVKE